MKSSRLKLFSEGWLAMSLCFMLQWIMVDNFFSSHSHILQAIQQVIIDCLHLLNLALCFYLIGIRLYFRLFWRLLNEHLLRFLNLGYYWLLIGFIDLFLWLCLCCFFFIFLLLLLFYFFTNYILLLSLYLYTLLNFLFHSLWRFLFLDLFYFNFLLWFFSLFFLFLFHNHILICILNLTRRMRWLLLINLCYWLINYWLIHYFLLHFCRFCCQSNTLGRSLNFLLLLIDYFRIFSLFIIRFRFGYLFYWVSFRTLHLLLILLFFFVFLCLLYNINVILVLVFFLSSHKSIYAQKSIQKPHYQNNLIMIKELIIIYFWLITHTLPMNQMIQIFMQDQAVVLIFFSALPFLALTPARTFQIRAILSFPSLSLIIETLEGWIGIWQGAPLALFFVNLSM